MQGNLYNPIQSNMLVLIFWFQEYFYFSWSEHNIYVVILSIIHKDWIQLRLGKFAEYELSYTC